MKHENDNDIPMPPEELQKWVGPVTGSMFLRHGKVEKNKIIENCKNFSSTSAILDIGTGCGRTARHFCNALDAASGGKYYGFDVHAPSIEWCKENISSKYSNFHFETVDVFNSMYNPGTAQGDFDVWERADVNMGSENKMTHENLVLPYENESIDISFALSVFTHMTKEYVKKYLQEIYRVSKKGSYHDFTFFTTHTNMRDGWVDAIQPFHRPAAVEAIKSTVDGVDFWSPESERKLDEFSWVLIPRVPCAVIIYHKDYIGDLIKDVGFKILQAETGWQSRWTLKK